MSAPSKLYKTSIVIWTDFDPQHFEIGDLAREATEGEAFCSHQNTEVITDPRQFPQTEFFNGFDL